MNVKKEQLYRLIDEIPERERTAALRYLQYLRDLGEDPVIVALHAAALDQEAFMPDEERKSDSAWNDYLKGKDPGKELDEYLREQHE